MMLLEFKDDANGIVYVNPAFVEAIWEERRRGGAVVVLKMTGERTVCVSESLAEAVRKLNRGE